MEHLCGDRVSRCRRKLSMLVEMNSIKLFVIKGDVCACVQIPATANGKRHTVCCADGRLTHLHENATAAATAAAAAETELHLRSRARQCRLRQSLHTTTIIIDFTRVCARRIDTHTTLCAPRHLSEFDRHAHARNCSRSRELSHAVPHIPTYPPVSNHMSRTSCQMCVPPMAGHTGVPEISTGLDG